MPNRSKDWMRQAEHDLGLARLSRGASFFEWACFAAHQAAEKAVKALHLGLRQEVWGHVVRRLLEELPQTLELPPALVDRARVLDSYYIPTRSPNGHPEGAPAEHYGDMQAEEAIQHAEAILEFCSDALAEPGDG